MAPVLNNSGGIAPREEASLKVPAKKDEDLSEEDLALKQQLELYVERAQDTDSCVQKAALEGIRHEIQTSTSSMTFVPKPLKFLRPHYGSLKAYFETMAESDMKEYLANILSVLASTMSAEGERESLRYRQLGSQGDIKSWGLEYIRNLSGEIVAECSKRRGEQVCVDNLLWMVEEIVDFHLEHNAEAEAFDLLMEIEYDDMILQHVDTQNFKRTCLYMTSFGRYHLVLGALPELAYFIYLHFEEYVNALQMALSYGSTGYVEDVLESCDDLLQKKQLCYILARHGITIELNKRMVSDDSDREELQEIVNNSHLSEGYLTLARDIEVMEPKSPEDVYKAHLLDGRASASASVDPAWQNLAAMFVNAFVNAGFGQDKLVTIHSDSSSSIESTGNWLFKDKEHGKASAVASLGMIFLWDVDSGLAQLNKYFHGSDTQVLAGGLLGAGIVKCNIKNESDNTLAVLVDYADDDEDASVRICAIMGLGLAYAGSQNDQIRTKLTPILNDAKESLDVVAFAAISLGLVYVGSYNKGVANSIASALMNRSESELGEPLAHFLPLGLGLVYLGMQYVVEATAEVSKKLNENIRKHCDITLLSCAYAGTGNVLKVQELLGHCAQHLEKGETHQGHAVLGIAMVAMAEEIGLEMAIRSMDHLLQYGERNIRRAVPLALGLLCISNPKVNVMDTLSRLSHDADSEVAMAAVVSLGLIGAGTNNARIAGMLRNLSCYSYKDSDLLFCVRIAQGLLHMGKGLLTLNPYHSDRILLSPTALAGIVIMLHACLDMRSIILGKYHYVLYFLVLAMQPRMLLTVDEDLEPLSVPVRVGQAVDVVAQAGHPKTITGFRTHSTPVILAAGERAELATEKYIPLSPVLEGFVILKENPEYMKELEADFDCIEPLPYTSEEDSTGSVE